MAQHIETHFASHDEAMFLFFEATLCGRDFRGSPQKSMLEVPTVKSANLTNNLQQLRML